MGVACSKNSLSPEEFDELVQSTDFSSAEIDEWFQKFRQDFPKGHISQREFTAVYKKLFPAGDPDRFCRHIFRVYDRDGNSIISFNEFLLALHVTAYGSVDDKLRASFRLYDVDRNGFVTINEITQILTCIYGSRPNKPVDYKEKAKTDAASIMCQLDADNDQKLSVDEFVNAATSCAPLMDILKGVKS